MSTVASEALLNNPNHSNLKTKRENALSLEIKNLSKVFNSKAGRVIALKNINFSIPKGQFVSIVGPSGSGKSTLLNMIGALDKPTRGSVIINGINILAQSDYDIANFRNNMIGFVFQSFNLINRSTVQKNVELPAIISGIDTVTRSQRALKLLKILGIQDKLEQKPINLSGGEQQRVAIARALINNPSIILADEPTGNLDSKTGSEIFSLLQMLSKKYDRTIIIVTHNIELAKQTDRSIYLKDGMIEKEIMK